MAEESKEISLSERSQGSPFRGQIQKLLENGQAASETHARTIVAANWWLAKARGETKKWESIAKTDDLSGLGRKEGYAAALARKFKEFKAGKTKLYLIAFDLDHFSWLNDTFNCHLLGDICLQVTGAIVRENIRNEDLAFRVGGEEFTIIPNKTGPDTIETAVKISRRIVNSVDRELLERVIKIAVSGKRMIKDPITGREEREGTLALKEFARGILKARESIDTQDDVFKTMKGTSEQKEALAERVMDLNRQGYQEFIEDQRTLPELDKESLEKRRAIEEKIGQDVREVFESISCSAGLFYFKPEDRKAFLSQIAVDGFLDRLVNKAKKKGGNALAMQVGIDGSPKLVK